MAAASASHMADLGADASMARRMETNVGGRPPPPQSPQTAVAHTAEQDALEAPDNLRKAYEALAANQFDNCVFGLNLAVCECAPMVLQPPETRAVQLLQEAVLYKLCASVFRGVQDSAALQKTQPLQPQASRRQVLLCIFLCSLADLQPKHRVRFMRRTIQLGMRNGNFGLAAPYLENLLRYAKANRAKLEAELQQCREQQFVNTADVPDLSRVDVTSMGLDQSVAFLEEARACATAELEAEDLSSLGLAYHMLGDSARSLGCLEDALARTAPGGVEEAEVQASLCLAYHAVQQTQLAEAARGKSMDIYTALMSGAEVV